MNDLRLCNTRAVYPDSLTVPKGSLTTVLRTKSGMRVPLHSGSDLRSVVEPDELDLDSRRILRLVAPTGRLAFTELRCQLEQSGRVWLREKHALGKRTPLQKKNYCSLQAINKLGPRA